jgi:hypothetical protein
MCRNEGGMSQPGQQWGRDESTRSTMREGWVNQVNNEGGMSQQGQPLLITTGKVWRVGRDETISLL